MTDRVVNLREYHVGYRQYNLPADVVRVDRGTPWGNPYPIPKPEKAGDREAVIGMFARYAIAKARQEPDWLTPLAGKRLACHCAPSRCHAEVLIELLDMRDEDGIVRPGEGMGKLQFGVDRLPAKEAEAAPAWPSLDELERAVEHDYIDFIRGRR